jgi:uncharacterized protein
MHKLYQEDNSRQSTVLPKPPKKRFRYFKYWVKVCQRRFYLSIRKLKGKPAILARGVAVGVFAGCFPFFGLQSLIGILLATIFQGSKVAAVAGTWVSNPLTYVPLFVFNFKIGELLLGIESISSQELDFESFSHFMEFGSTFVITLLVGCTVVGAIAALISYFVSLSMFKRFKLRRFKHRGE